MNGLPKREIEEHVFPNGIRLAHKQVNNTKIAHCGFVLDVGSRDERPHEQGIAHFWEHMAFKGTERRKAFHILNRIDSVGGELNAYTTKEKICFYASLIDTHFEKAVELLTDITFHSTFPEKELQREKGVILEEMMMYLDDPGDAILDEFDELVFPGHPLGWNILGNKESVSDMQRAHFQDFIAHNLNTHQLVFASVSALPFKKVLKTVGRHLSALPEQKPERERLHFSGYTPKQHTVLKPINQAHCIMGNTAFSLYQKERIPFFVLVNLLGGPGMNSRLNLSIREKHGFVYAIDANNSAYQDVGLFSISFATDPKSLERCLKLVMRELKRLREQKLGSLQLHTAKQQLMGQLAMAEESNLGLMLMIGKSMLDMGKVEELGAVFAQIEKVTPEHLLELANQVFNDSDMSMLTYLPEEGRL